MPSQVSERMKKVGQKNTAPEMIVRRLLYSMGYRYRLYVADLPGKPDIVFKSRRKVIFINGCFWHGHANCKRAKPPKSNLGYWLPKLAETKRRDQSNYDEFKKMEWQSYVVWECETSDLEELSQRLRSFLG